MIITVHNRLKEGLSIHSHGILQMFTNTMDGVAAVTERPLMPGVGRCVYICSHLTWGTCLEFRGKYMSVTIIRALEDSEDIHRAIHIRVGSRKATPIRHTRLTVDDDGSLLDIPRFAACITQTTFF
eukprot:gene10676-10835_t